MNKKTVDFGSSIKAEAKIKKEPELTLEQKVGVLFQHTNQHAIAINAICDWIAMQDPTVKQAGNVVNWSTQLSQMEKHLAKRKAEYEAKKDGK